ncbi:phosphonate metabolism protein [Camelimonas fluminis]|uniref:DUF1045 domain-containing protein n=1 Tax=Camelimonas fluminis TaxID=1576911 RepID=A0ABV7UFR1_9HYPH|nr:DUF1045 domain-containing protein [Camelimonas fluminis]GHE72413.1 phosphonate metabolism protein [Camelimonas fluminis]
MRYAIYFTPAPQSPLHQRGGALLGYDCYSGVRTPPAGPADIPAPELAASVQEAWKYGFHATIKPPFNLREGTDASQLQERLADWAANTAPLSIGTMRVAGPGNFVALEPETPSLALQMFAAETVAWFDDFRAPLTPTDLARRPPERLTPRQRVLQQRWGYPYVFEAFRFHMTLSDALTRDRLAAWRAALGAWFGPLDLTIDALTLLAQDERGGPFRVVSRHRLAG